MSSIKPLMELPCYQSILTKFNTKITIRGLKSIGKSLGNSFLIGFKLKSATCFKDFAHC
jgi:hypothetical protein